MEASLQNHGLHISIPKKAVAADDASQLRLPVYFMQSYSRFTNQFYKPGVRGHSPSRILKSSTAISMFGVLPLTASNTTYNK